MNFARGALIFPCMKISAGSAREGIFIAHHSIALSSPVFYSYEKCSDASCLDVFYSSFRACRAPVSSRSFPVLYQSPVIGWFIFPPSLAHAQMQGKERWGHMKRHRASSRALQWTSFSIAFRINVALKEAPKRSCAAWLFASTCVFAFRFAWMAFIEATKHIYVKTEK